MYVYLPVPPVHNQRRERREMDREQKNFILEMLTYTGYPQSVASPPPQQPVSTLTLTCNTIQYRV